MHNAPNGLLNGDIGHPDSVRSHFDEKRLNNPTVLPEVVLKQFQFAFLIRHPQQSLPSYYRCTVPPLSEMTGFSKFMPSETGYRELRLIIDYLRSTGQVGPGVAGVEDQQESRRAGSKICVIDADDLLDNPSGVIKAFCGAVGLEFNPSMLTWDTPAHRDQAHAAFAKWRGFHEDALDRTELTPRKYVSRHQCQTSSLLTFVCSQKKMPKNIDQDHADWVGKYGIDAANVLRKTVQDNIEDYEYLKQFALKA